MSLDEDVRTMATGRNFAALTTLMPDGQPQTQMMWVDADDDHLLVNTEVGRQKFRNVEHDPRVTITVWDINNPYRYVEVRGKVVAKISGDQARAHIDACSRRYTGNDYTNPIASERVLLKIAPDRVHRNGV